MRLEEINSNNGYGRRLLAAMTFLTTEQFPKNTPDEVLDILEQKAFEMYGAQYPVGECQGPATEIINDREPTFGELAVGLSFNPSNLSEVDKVKRAFASLIDTCSDISTFTYLGNTLKGMAIRACIEAQMAVVKLVTFKEK
jgi:hypothetical protein